MNLISVNVGIPRDVPWKGKTVSTGIFKEPVAGRVALRRLNLEGDGQADLSVHGGVEKAVYAYPAEHYPYWRGELPGKELSWGMFGENFTSEGLLEDQVRIGDRFRVGSAELFVTQPRQPCFKLGLKFGRADFVKQFLVSLRSGFYFAVLQEGEVSAGDSIELLARDEQSLTVTEILRLYLGDLTDEESLRRAAELEALPESWRKHLRRRSGAGRGRGREGSR